MPVISHIASKVYTLKMWLFQSVTPGMFLLEQFINKSYIHFISKGKFAIFSAFLYPVVLVAKTTRAEKERPFAVSYMQGLCGSNASFKTLLKGCMWRVWEARCAHALAYVWMPESKLGYWFSSSTLFKRVSCLSLCTAGEPDSTFCCVTGWASLFTVGALGF